MVRERRVPSVRGRQLARELRELRAAHGMTGEQIADELGWSSAKVSRIENARTTLTLSDLRKLLNLYSVPEATAERLLNLARTANERGWWQVYADTMTQNFATLIGLEDEARVMHSYHLTLVPGLLQTENYHRAIIEANGPHPHGVVERRVQIRLNRQRRLHETEPLEVWAVLDEAVLRRAIGGAEVMHEQLMHLLRLAEKPNITLQVLPYDAGAHSGVAGTFTTLGFSHPDDPNITTLETLVGTLIIEDPVQVFTYDRAFDELRSRALEAADANDMISLVAAEYKQGK